MNADVARDGTSHGHCRADLTCKGAFIDELANSADRGARHAMANA